MAFGEIADALDRRRVAAHRIEALEDDQLRTLNALATQQLFEMSDIIVAEDALLGARLPAALDHRIVVVGI